MDEFVCQIRGKKEEAPGPSNYHVNMACVLSSMFCAEPDQPATMEGDYLATEPMTAFVNVKEVEKDELSSVDLPEPIRKKPERVYYDQMVFSRPNPALFPPI